MKTILVVLVVVLFPLFGLLYYDIFNSPRALKNDECISEGKVMVIEYKTPRCAKKVDLS